VRRPRERRRRGEREEEKGKARAEARRHGSGADRREAGRRRCCPRDALGREGDEERGRKRREGRGEDSRGAPTRKGVEVAVAAVAYLSQERDRESEEERGGVEKWKLRYIFASLASDEKRGKQGKNGRS